ncbi:MAG: GNAT family N-acetyltransferase [Acidimicrobiales bacterium]
MEIFGQLVREYVASLPFSIDFQDIDRELRSLATEYGPPTGSAFLAFLAGESVGCSAIRALAPGVAEMKRMYVRPQARGLGLGSRLAKEAVEEARALGYERIRLDTVSEMVAAAHVYSSLGFTEIERYRENPLGSARYYELRLTS